MRLDKFPILFFEQNKFEWSSSHNYLDQYKDEYNIHEFNEQKNLWCANATV